MMTLKTKDTKKKFGLRNLATICYETLQYLEETPCKFQSKEKIVEFREAVKKFNLSNSECFMMANDPPTSPLHIQILVEDSEERLTEEQVSELLRIVEQTLLS
uniref:DNA-directed RNA polymerase III subunit RPC9 n=2 Tax=Phlebotomus papatasi TaxID=29031 RepID=A0A1B0DJT1_PHLPP